MIGDNIVTKVFDYIKQKSIMIKYCLKCKKLNISSEFLSYLSYRTNMKDTVDILNIINKSGNSEKFKKLLFDYIRKNPTNYYNKLLLVGTLIGQYNFYSDLFNLNKININNIENFNCEDRDKVLEILKERFYDYVMNNNSVKNELYCQNNNVKRLYGDINFDDINKLFDDFVSGKKIDSTEYYKVKVIQKYIFTIVNRYTINDIFNNFGFIEYDMQSEDDEDIDKKRDKYNKHKYLNSAILTKIDNLKVLKNRLKEIKNEEAEQLLKRLNNIENPYQQLDEIEDIYLEYELLFRNDLLHHLFIPKEDVTLVDDFRLVEPQLIHSFLRTPPGKFREKLTQKIIDRIIQDRNNNDESSELSLEEQERFNKLLYELDVELNQTQVNYSFDSRVGSYTDSTGFGSYISDTTNQISASLYSETYFNDCSREMIDIGFNLEGLMPEAIVLSSPVYLTTNKGLNNIECESSKEFLTTSASYGELIKNDGNSEVVLFRRNIDYDTKASYVFVAFDSQYNKKFQELIDKGRKMAKENDLKLVLYDLAKIRNSYKLFTEKNDGYSHSDSVVENNYHR